jgi:hypothetical protein
MARLEYELLMALPYTLEEHKKAVKKAHGNKLKIISTNYTLRDSIMRYKFTECGHEFERRADYVVQGSGSRCSECIKLRNLAIKNKPKIDRRLWNTERYQKELLIKHPHIVCLEEYDVWAAKLKHKCAKHGIFYQSPAHALRSKRDPCLECGYEIRNTKNRKTNEHIVGKIFDKHGTKVKLNESYRGIREVHEFICDKGHTWKTTVDSVIRVSGCPKCCRNPAFSKAEKQWISLMKQYINPNILTMDDEVINIYLPGFKRSIRPDGYDPATKTVYEFHGDFWHGNLSVYKKSRRMFTNQTIDDANRATRKREKALLKAGYRVVYVWENDFKRYLKSRFRYKHVPFIVAELSKSPYCY